MRLSGQQLQELQEALIDAFPTKASLEQMLAFELDKNLDAIAGGDNLREIVFNLIKVAYSQGWLKDLIRAAYNSNPGNLLLRAILQEVLTEQALQPQKILTLQLQELQEALIDAFPTKASLERMLTYELDKNLDAITGGGNLQDIVFNLIRVADSQGWLEDLIRAAYNSNPGNLRLRAILQEVLTEQALQPQKILTLEDNPHTQPLFDVFLAHNSKDKPFVRKIANKLKQRGLKPWLDEEQIPPGRLFQDEIQQAISVVKSAAIFIGSQGLGKWQSLELRSLISQFVYASIPVIPVLLPGVKDIPEDLSFVQTLPWVIFADGIDDLKALNNLEWSITGRKPGSQPKTSNEQYFDIFLCYNSKDEKEVKQIGEELKKHQIRPWLDLWETPVGTSWQELLAEQIPLIKLVAVFIGNNGGPWQRKEIESLIWRFIELERPVISVFLKSAPPTSKLPIYLQRLTKVDFRKQDPNPMTDLVLLITGKKQ